MHPNDIIISVLTPGGAFNPQGKVFRGLDTLAAFTGLAPADVLGILQGDLNSQAVCKPSKKKAGKILVALKTNIPKKVKADGPVKIAAMPIEPPAPAVMAVTQEMPSFVQPAGVVKMNGKQYCTNPGCTCQLEKLPAAGPVAGDVVDGQIVISGGKKKSSKYDLDCLSEKAEVVKANSVAGVLQEECSDQDCSCQEDDLENDFQ